MSGGLFVAGFVVLLEKIFSPVVCQIAPYRMDVIGVILSIVVFDQKRGRLYTIVMRTALLRHARPGEVDILAGLLEQIHTRSGQLIRHIVCVDTDEVGEHLHLFRVHLGGRKPVGDGVVLTEMVAFDTEAPRTGIRGRAEDADT
jgi:hypothetical protein